MGERYYVTKGDEVVVSPVDDGVMQGLLAGVFGIAKFLGYTRIYFSIERGEEHWARSYDAPAETPPAKISAEKP